MYEKIIQRMNIGRKMTETIIINAIKHSTIIHLKSHLIQLVIFSINIYFV